VGFRPLGRPPVHDPQPGSGLERCFPGGTDGSGRDGLVRESQRCLLRQDSGGVPGGRCDGGAVIVSIKLRPIIAQKKQKRKEDIGLRKQTPTAHLFSMHRRSENA
jgi:chorismate synthase